MPFRQHSTVAWISFGFLLVFTLPAPSQPVTTNGFLNLPRTEAPGTLLSHPVTNGSEPIGRTTSINYLNGWIIVGGESPGSRPGSDLVMRVYDIEDPENPVRRLPSDFELTYPNNWWHQGNFGVHAHATMQSESLLLPQVLRAQTFGGLLELGGTNGIPALAQMPMGYDRGSMAGPWEVNALWYFTPDDDIRIQQAYLTNFGFVDFNIVATLDHVGEYGGGDWHPMLFGDLLIMARSGAAATDGVVVYRLEYVNFDDPIRANRSIIPHFVGSLDAGFQGYWPNLFSDGTGLYVIGSTTDILIGADITQAADPAGDGSVHLAASLPVPGFSNASYPVYQDQFGFIHNRKVDMTLFLAGDANPIVLTLDESNPPRQAGAPALPGGAIEGVDTSQISLPLGNLWLTGGYPIPGTNQGMGVWVHQQAADTAPPQVSYHIPQANRTNYPRHAPLSFMLHEHSRAGGPRNGIDFTLRPVGAGDVLGAAVTGFLIHDFSGVLSFTADAGLDADTTYQVDFLSNPVGEIGFRDAAGNYIEPYSFRFATGGGINADAPPVLSAVTADLYQPAPGQSVTITVAATGDPTLEYRFNFDGTWSSWGTENFASHMYPSEGRPRVLVQVRDGHGSIVNGSVKLLVLTPLPAGPRPTQSSTMAVGDDAGTRHVWSVNPDADTVTVIDAATGVKVAEYPVGVNPRSIARDANGRYWVTCHRSDEIRVLNNDGSAHTTITLDYGDAPFGVAASPDGQSLFVTMHGAAELHRYSAATPAAAPTIQTTFPTPRAMAITANGERVLVTRFISPELEAEIAEFAGTSTNLDFTRMFRLASANTIDGGDRASGVPNYLAGIAISPDGTRAAVVSKQDNILRGLGFGVSDLTHETTVRAVISILDLDTNTEIRHTRRDFDNSDSPSAVAYSPLGDTLLVALQGNNRIVGIDALNLPQLPDQQVVGATLTTPALLTFEVGTGLAPQGVLIDPGSQRLFSQNFMGRSVTVRDAAPLLVENRTSLPLIATTEAVTTELLTPTVLEGKQVFYNAADPRMSADSYISCATCHVDGGHDGRVWDFSGRGEGFRRTTDLRGRSGMGHGAVHWSGNFDEIQDFEHDIRGPFGGTGFLNLTTQQFAAQHPGPASGKTGLSSELDALAAYVASLTPEHAPRSPSRNSDGTLTASAASGQAVFAAQNCASCHSGDAFTNSTLMNVGTQSAISGSRLGQTLTGIDTPTLHGLHATRTFLHHGQAATLEEMFAYAGGTLRIAADETLLTTITPSGVGVTTDEFGQGGGGFQRGALGGTFVTLENEAGAASSPGVRFSNVEGGAGGAARIAIRYVKQYSGGSLLLRVNGVDQIIGLFQQYPNNSWQVSGWRWATVDVVLNAGSTNTIDVLRNGNDVSINALLISNADDLATAQPHRLVQSLPAGERDDLLAYLRQLDGRDATGTPLPAPTPADPLPPGIVSTTGDVTFAVGNAVNLTVVVTGTGPYTFQWYHGATPVGTDSPTFTVASAQAGDSGSYTVEITNAQGSIISDPMQVTIYPALAVDTVSLPAGTIGVAYNASLAASGGVSERTWSVASGVLPPGLSLSTAGEISGTTTVAARAEIVVQVSDASGSASQPLVLDVTPPGGFVNDPDLILHYTFDEGSGTRVWDSSPQGNVHATDVPGAHWVGDGRFGGAYGPGDTAAGFNRFFPANQGDLDFDPQGDAFTMSVWVRTTFNGGYRTLFGKGTEPPSAQVQYRLWSTNVIPNVQGVIGENYGPLLQTSAPALNDGQWHLLTMVNRLDGATWRTRVYYDEGSAFVEFNSGAGGTVPNLMRIGDTSFGGNGWNGQMDDFRIYRRALAPVEIGQLYAPPSNPVATLTRSPGQEVFSPRPFAEFDITFSREVAGLTVGDFVLSGTSGHSASLLSTFTEGTHYRLRVAGFTQAGTVTVQLPAGSVTAVDDAEPNPASAIALVNYTPPVVDDIAALSDEFGSAATLSDWQRNYLEEGWGASADKLETWDIDTSRAGHMRLMPVPSTWFNNNSGALVFKEVTGDFVATVRVDVQRRNGLPGRPQSDYTWAGLLVRAPRALTAAAPVPDPGPETVLPWPPDGSYTTEWNFQPENYIYLASGFGTNATSNDTTLWHYESKQTTNSNSNFYGGVTGVPTNESVSTLQIVRVGQTCALIRRHGAGDWIVQERYNTPNLPATVQVGVTAYTNYFHIASQDAFHHNRTAATGGNPDVVADFDYLHLQRPQPAVTEAALLALPLTGNGGAAALLSATALASDLGGNADAPPMDPGMTYNDWLRDNLTASQLIYAAQTDPGGDAKGNGTANAIAFVLGGDDTEPMEIEMIGTTVRLTMRRNSAARGATLIIESTTDLGNPASWTPLATSIDGAAPTGTATINETGAVIRTLEVEVPAGVVPTFYRARVVMP